MDEPTTDALDHLMEILRDSLREFFVRCHYYSGVFGSEFFHDLIGNALVSHVK